MSARFLAWYTAGASGLAAFLVSFITFAPGAEWFGWTLLLSFASAAIIFSLIGIVLESLPQTHWSNQSRTVRVTLSVIAVVASLVLLTSIG